MSMIWNIIENEIKPPSNKWRVKTLGLRIIPFAQSKYRFWVTTDKVIYHHCRMPF